MPSEAALEEVLNTRLADLLKTYGLDAEPEVKLGGGKRVDVMCTVNGHKVALEAKVGHPALRGGAAIADAAGRLKEGAAEAALAVCYPDTLSRMEDMERGTRIWVASMYGDWESCTVVNLASVIRFVVQDAGNVDAIALRFRQGLETAAGRLTEDQLYEIAEASGGPVEDLKAAGVRGALLVASAALFHARLDRHRRGLNRPVYDARRADGAKFTGAWPPPKLADCLADFDPVGRLTKAWDLILALDYKPVFETGIAVLRAPAQTPTLTAFAELACNAAMEVSRTIAGLRHDLLGRVFHRILPRRQTHRSVLHQHPGRGALGRTRDRLRRGRRRLRLHGGRPRLRHRHPVDGRRRADQAGNRRPGQNHEQAPDRERDTRLRHRAGGHAHGIRHPRFAGADCCLRQDEHPPPISGDGGQPRAGRIAGAVRRERADVADAFACLRAGGNRRRDPPRRTAQPGDHESALHPRLAAVRPSGPGRGESGESPRAGAVPGHRRPPVGRLRHVHVAGGPVDQRGWGDGGGNSAFLFLGRSFWAEGVGAFAPAVPSGDSSGQP